MKMPAEDPIQALVEELLNSRKYRALELPPETVRDLLEQELSRHRNSKDALKAVRHKLHTIVAPYLGDPDYDRIPGEMSTANAGGPAVLREACASVLSAHASTRERLPVLPDFYPRLFAVTGTPASILDLACGLNPFAWPWMGLPTSTCYHAYDIHAPRVAAINAFFQTQGLAPLAEVRDVLVHPPQIEADVAFLFKEAHRMEERRRGCSRPFWRAIKARWLLVSLPAESLSGKFQLAERQRALVNEAIGEADWPVSELVFGSEIVFCIDKRHDA
jgi:16S rRNA (guanine(1405)-N(7))-methyltransferase